MVREQERRSNMLTQADVDTMSKIILIVLAIGIPLIVVVAVWAGLSKDE